MWSAFFVCGVVIFGIIPHAQGKKKYTAWEEDYSICDCSGHEHPRIIGKGQCKCYTLVPFGISAPVWSEFNKFANSFCESINAVRARLHSQDDIGYLGQACMQESRKLLDRWRQYQIEENVTTSAYNPYPGVQLLTEGKCRGHVCWWGSEQDEYNVNRTPIPDKLFRNGGPEVHTYGKLSHVLWTESGLISYPPDYAKSDNIYGGVLCSRMTGNYFIK